MTGFNAQGGGIFNAGSLTLSSDNVSGNQAAGLTGSDGHGTDAEGGGIFNSASGILTLSNGTILAGNIAAGGAGGARAAAAAAVAPLTIFPTAATGAMAVAAATGARGSAVPFTSRPGT